MSRRSKATTRTIDATVWRAPIRGSRSGRPAALKMDEDIDRKGIAAATPQRPVRTRPAGLHVSPNTATAISSPNGKKNKLNGRTARATARRDRREAARNRASSLATRLKAGKSTYELAARNGAAA